MAEAADQRATSADWSHPVDLSDVQVVFSADALDYMPPRDECEAALEAMPRDERKKWIDFQQTWFARGLSKDTKVALKDGIDGDKAFRHLGAIQSSYAPQHEHKEAAVAYLASLWFHDVRDYKP